MNSSAEKIWITWSDHRRSRELASKFGADYLVLDSSLVRPFRYIFLTTRTVKILFYLKPKKVFCQNPSIVLAALLSLIKPLFRYHLVVDRHSNFKFDTEGSILLKWKVFHFLSDYSIKKADVTIVTNKQLAKIVDKKGGRAAVLPDKIPDLIEPRFPFELPERFKFLFICTFSEDEPVKEVLDCFKLLGSEYGVYITGNPKGFPEKINYDGIFNIHFLGFVSDEDYVRYLFSSDATITLTSAQMTLNCGSYEAIAANKPQIISATEVIKDYFYQGAYYLKTFNPKDIVEGVKFVSKNLEKLKVEVEDLNNDLDERWELEFKKLSKTIDDQSNLKRT